MDSDVRPGDCHFKSVPADNPPSPKSLADRPIPTRTLGRGDGVPPPLWATQSTTRHHRFKVAEPDVGPTPRSEKLPTPSPAWRSV